MSTNLTRQIGTFVSALRWADVPASARTATRRTAANVVLAFGWSGNSRVTGVDAVRGHRR